MFAELFDDDEKWHDEWRMSGPIDHAAVLQAHLLSMHEPAPSFSSPRPHGRDQLPLSGCNNRLRCTDRLQIFSWNRGPVWSDNISAVANRMDGPYHVVCVQEGVVFTSCRALEESFHVVTAHHSACY